MERQQWMEIVVCVGIFTFLIGSIIAISAIYFASLESRREARRQRVTAPNIRR